MGLIYRIQNNQNNKTYVGKTEQTLKSRLRRHRVEVMRGTNRPLYNSLRKHGFDAFTIDIIEEVANELLIEREQFWIKQFDCIHPNGYNFTTGGEGGNVKRFWTEEARFTLHKQQAEKRRGQKRTAAQRENFSKVARLRESRKTQEMKRLISNKISTKLKEIGRRPPITKLYGKDHPNWVDIDVNEVLEMIRLKYRLKDIAQQFNTSNQVLWHHLKQTGKSYKQWREYYAVGRGYRRLGPNERFKYQEV